ncbi:MG284/MPN403 family protein [Mycoplasma sp. T193]|uniref:MG284/MPN403 family protein n=1 Tax=Mycoplasma sp. T193 TaxID=3401666 RepID=UPI003AAB1587
MDKKDKTNKGTLARGYSDVIKNIHDALDNETKDIKKYAQSGNIEALKNIYDSNGLNLKNLYDAIENIIKYIITAHKEAESKNKQKLALLWIQYMTTKDEQIKEIIDEMEQGLKRTNSIFNYILAMMSAENSWIIHKTYIDPATKDNKHWYLEYFSKTTFYKKKHSAILEFGKFLLQLDYD